MNIEPIIELFEKYGSHDYIGEDVSQIEHMVQAAMLAEEDNQSVEVVLAALFHDIGHFLQLDGEKLGNYGIKNHEKIGSKFLRDHGFKSPIPELVENHVKVKRYRVYKNPKYLDNLSEASKITLKMQGGPMNLKEAKEFENSKYFELSLKIRDYDDLAKVVGKKVKSLDYFRKLSSKL